MKTKYNQLQLLIMLFLISFSTYSQNTVVHGKITTFHDITVENAEIAIKKSKASVFSDSLGYFSIACAIKDKISIKAAGFKTKLIKVKNLKDSLNIDLVIQGDEKGIDLAVSRGHINKSKLNLAKEHLNTKQSYSLGYTTMTELILGKFPGVQIVNDELIIRGFNSHENRNGALIIIKGTDYTWAQVKHMIVSNIKNIRILTSLKASRYGTGSGNGVVVVTLIDE